MGPVGNLQSRHKTDKITAAGGVAETGESRQPWELIKRWFSHSIPDRGPAGHGSMARRPNSFSNDILPARLIHVGSSDGSVEPRISESQEEWGGAPYMTLSHRWPSPEQEQEYGRILRLTKTNSEAMWTRCPLTELAPTFRDAIQVARELEIEYLWIDCLCIIQDDYPDKKREISKMGQIYKNALCNIAAAEEYHPQLGLFRPRYSNNLKPFKVHVRRPFPTMRLRDDMRGSYFIVNTDFKKRNVYDAPVNKRAWVVQERCLSSRVLTFTRNQVFWQSGKFGACETFPYGYPRKLSLVDDKFNPLQSSDFERPHQMASASSSELLGKWSAIVGLYGPCTLTDQRDRLKAIEGLATLFKERFEADKYMVGLWESTMPVSLLWRVNEGRTSDGSWCKRLQETDFPTWSWVSVQGDVLLERASTAGANQMASRTVATVVSCQQNVESQSCLVNGSNSTPLTLHAGLYSLELADLWDFGENSDTSKRSAMIKVRTAQISGSVLAACALDDPDDFSSRWKVDNANYILWLRRSTFLLAAFSSIVIPVFATQGKLRSLTFAYVFVFGCLICAVVPLSVPSTKFRLGLGCPNSGLFLLPILESRFHEGLVVSIIEGSNIYRREGYYYSGSLDRKLSKLPKQDITLM